ncbi:hypothetical protein OESDEN_08515 [Oesophagostomum dentatum]|uniref:Uncharacterized protein n=1 Tax=Oesophagostomum dentatum TaxID=61180 RepID=A0A0B1T664_OESDE|nr:hypothetical protein OESDEN_08515 [Oesophagostomum dentatum]
MPRRGSLLSSEEQAQIRALHAAGLSNRAIAQQLGRSHGCIDRYVRNPSGYNSNNASGRPQLLSSQDKRRIRRFASNSTASLAQMKAELSLGVSRMTIWRSLKESENLRREKMQKALRLNAQHRQMRLAFARNNMTTRWEEVIFSDEKSSTYMAQTATDATGEICGKIPLSSQRVTLVEDR